MIVEIDRPCLRNPRIRDLMTSISIQSIAVPDEKKSRQIEITFSQCHSKYETNQKTNQLFGELKKNLLRQQFIVTIF